MHNIEQINSVFYNWLSDYIKQNGNKMDIISKVIIFNIHLILNKNCSKSIIDNLEKLTLSDVEKIPTIQNIILSNNLKILKLEKNILQQYEYFVNEFNSLEFILNEESNYYSLSEDQIDNAIPEFINKIHLTYLTNNVFSKEVSFTNLIYLENTMLNAYANYEIIMGNSILRTLNFLDKKNIGFKASLNYLVCQQNVAGHWGKVDHDDVQSFLELNFDCLWTINQALNPYYKLSLAG